MVLTSAKSGFPAGDSGGVKGRGVPQPKTSRRLPWQPVLAYVFLAVGLFCLSAFYVSLQRRHARAYAVSELSALADLKAMEVGTWRSSRLDLGTAIAEDRFFAARVRRLLSGPDAEAARQEIVTELAAIRGMIEATIILKDSHVLLTYPERPAYVESPQTAYLRSDALTSGKSRLGDPERNPSLPGISMPFVVPLLDLDRGADGPGAVIVFDIDPRKVLFSMFEQWPMPSATSEIMLVRRDGKDFLQLSDSRLGGNIALAARMPIAGFHRPGTDKSLGEEGAAEGTDYRGRKVLAYIKGVPASPWLIMAKVDVSEIAASRGVLPGVITLLLVALVLGSGAVLAIFWRRQGASLAAEEQDRWEKAVKDQNEFLRVMIDVMPNAAYFKDGAGVIVGCNAALERLVNLSKDKILGKTFAELGLGALGDKEAETDRSLVEKPDVRVYEHPLKSWDGTEHDIIFIKSSFRRPDGTHGGLIVTLIDITQRKRTEQELSEIRRFSDGIIQTMTEGLVLTDGEGRFSFVNPAAAGILGYRADEMVGREVVSFVPKDQIPIVRGADERRARGISDRYELAFLHKDGSRRTVHVSGGPRIDGVQGGGTMAVLTDITERKRMEEEIRALSLLDELTKLYNRRGFLTLAEQQLKYAHRLKRRAFLVYADVDSLKSINDTFGHEEGDRALVQFAGILRKSFRDSDIIGRLGGDEFVILAIEANRASPDTFTGRLQEKLDLYNLQAPGDETRRTFRLAVSTGVVTYDPEFPSTLQDMLSQADRLMYDRKRAKKA